MPNQKPAVGAIVHITSGWGSAQDIWVMVAPNRRSSLTLAHVVIDTDTRENCCFEPGKPLVLRNHTEMEWCVVPDDDVPREVWAALARYKMKL